MHRPFLRCIHSQKRNRLLSRFKIVLLCRFNWNSYGQPVHTFSQKYLLSTPCATGCGLSLPCIGPSLYSLAEKKSIALKIVLLRHFNWNPLCHRLWANQSEGACHASAHRCIQSQKKKQLAFNILSLYLLVNWDPHFHPWHSSNDNQMHWVVNYEICCNVRR